MIIAALEAKVRWNVKVVGTKGGVPDNRRRAAERDRSLHACMQWSRGRDIFVSFNRADEGPTEWSQQNRSCFCDVCQSSWTTTWIWAYACVLMTRSLQLQLQMCCTPCYTFSGGESLLGVLRFLEWEHETYHGCKVCKDFPSTHLVWMRNLLLFLTKSSVWICARTCFSSNARGRYCVLLVAAILKIIIYLLNTEWKLHNTYWKHCKDTTLCLIKDKHWNGRVVTP